MYMPCNKIAVFCGSAKGKNKDYKNAAISLAKEMAEASLDLVYGGGSIGLMGIIADELLSLNRKVYGIIPKKIYDWEVGHEHITELTVVDDMHERKAKMAEMSDAFIAMPGGIGTLEEIVEAFTWLQLGYHHKPCAFLNVNGYYDHLIQFFDSMVAEGFLKQNQRDGLIIAERPKHLIEILLSKTL